MHEYSFIWAASGKKSIAIKSKHTFFCSFSSILVHPLFLPWVIISAHQQKLSSSFPEVHFYLFTIIAHNSVLWVYYGHCVRMSRRIATFSTARRQRELSTKKMRKKEKGRQWEKERKRRKRRKYWIECTISEAAYHMEMAKGSRRERTNLLPNIFSMWNINFKRNALLP